MKPKLLRLSDLWFVGVALLIVGLTTTFVVWNLVNGEQIPIGGWVTTGATVVGVVTLIIIYYVQRWFWVRKYAYTIRGVSYFYVAGIDVYQKVGVDTDILNMLRKWISYYVASDTIPARIVSEISKGVYIKDVTCIFRHEKTWTHTAPGWWTRKVTGLQKGSLIVVGHGGRPIDRTAHAHELSHVLFERVSVGNIPGKDLEKVSHKIFEEVGV